MKKRKFSDGGRFEEDTYERAKRFLQQSGAEGETPALDEILASKRAARSVSRPPIKTVEGDEGPAITRTVDTSGAEADDRRAAAESLAARSRAMAPAAPAPRPAAPAPRAAAPAPAPAPADVPPLVSPPQPEPDRLVSNRNRMGERAAQQMEEKGSIYSRDYGKPRAEREAAAAVRQLPTPRSQRMFQSRRRTPYQAAAVAGNPGYAKGGSVSSASSRADGIAKRGKTKGRVL
jgi:hypothetical protein